MCGDVWIFTVVNITSGNVEIKIQNDKLGNVASMIRLPDNKTFLLGIGGSGYCVFDYEAIVYTGTLLSTSYDYTLKLSKIIFNDKK